MPDVLLRLRELGHKLIPYVSPYKMRDVGTTEDWLQTNNELAERGWKV